jgi:hypothetical protein
MIPYNFLPKLKEQLFEEHSMMNFDLPILNASSGITRRLDPNHDDRHQEEKEREGEA